jgi:hypothetical protein
MKKKFLFTLALFWCAFLSFGQTFTVNGLNYSVTSSTEASVAGQGGSASGNVSIPDTVTNLGVTYSVTAISFGAFKDCFNLTSVTLPNSVLLIGDSVFMRCFNLSSINIPNSVTIIDNNAFQECSSLTSISIPNSVTTINQGAFYHCDNLSSVYIPDSVTFIGAGAFKFCSNLATVNIPNGTTIIRDETFAGCAFTSITIPNTVTTIKIGAFSGCYLLTSIKFPNSVTSIENAAFQYDTAITTITFSNPQITFSGNYHFYQCTSLALININSTSPPSSIANSSFQLVNQSAVTLRVPSGSKPAYLTASVWKDFLITDIQPLVVTAASQTNLNCYGDSNGTASVNLPTGGTAPYTYDWTPGNPTGDGTRSVTGLTAGTWVCTVSDTNGVTTTQSFTITSPEAPVASIATTLDLCTTVNSTTSVTVTTNAVAPTYTWQYRVVTSTTTGSWTTITATNAGAIYSNYTTATLGIKRTTTAVPAAGTEYQVLVTNSGCSTLTSNKSSLTINPVVVNKTITGALPVMCYGSTKTLILGAGSVGTVQLQRNISSSTTAPVATDANWTDLGSPIIPTTAINPTVSLVINNLTDTAWYRVKLTSGLCSSATTLAPVQVIVNPTSAGGTLTATNNSLCTGSVANLSLSGYIGTIKWYKSTDYGTVIAPTLPTWTLVTGALSTLSSTLTTTTWFRATITSGVCSQAYSNVIAINVSPKVLVKTITGATPVICSGDSKMLTLGVGSVGTIQWQRNISSSTAAPTVTDVNWTNIGTAIAPTTAINATNVLTLTNVTNTAWYRVKFTSGPCAEATSTAVQVTVNPTSALSTLTVGAAEVCTGSATTLNFSSHTGTLKWFKSVDYGTALVPTWTAVAGTTPALATGILTVKTWYKAEATSGVCSVAVSNVVSVSITPKPIAKNFVATQTIPTGALTQPLCTNLSTEKTFIILDSGTVGAIQWQAVASETAPTTASAWTDIVGANTRVYTVGQNGFIPTVGANYFRVKFSNGSCADVFSTTAVVYYASCLSKSAPQTAASEGGVGAALSVKAFPNPFANNFNLNCTTVSEEKINIKVYDMTGRLVEQNEMSIQGLSDQQLGDHYPSGIYNVVLTQGEQVKTVRVIKK